MLNLMAVSLESGKRHKAYAVYDGERIAITHCVPIVGPPSNWAAELLKEVADKVSNGFSVLVEDRTGTYVASDASQFDFEEVIDGRSMLYHALDWYFSMLDLGQIITDPSVERYLIRAGGEGQKIDRLQDDRGRTIYKVDWSAMNGGVKAVLMCVCGAMMQPMSERYIDAMFGPAESEKGELYDPQNVWESIAKGYDQTQIKKWDKFYDE